MGNLILKTKRCLYYVTKNDDGTINISKEIGGENIPNIGWYINSMGGIDGILKRCIETESTIEEIKKEIAQERKEEMLKAEARKIEAKKKIVEKYENLINSAEVIEVTIDNLRIVMMYLKSINWGVWKLPKMSCSYTANQYDCDGVTAVTITLEKPITDESWEIVNCKQFVLGAPRGHLTKYTRI